MYGEIHFSGKAPAHDTLHLIPLLPVDKEHTFIMDLIALSPGGDVTISHLWRWPPGKSFVLLEIGEGWGSQVKVR